MTKETKKPETLMVWIPRYALRNLPNMWDKVVGGSPFKGSRLRFTGNVRRRHRGEYRNAFGECSFRIVPSRYEFEVEPSCLAFTPIPGHRLVGFAEREDGCDAFSIHRVGHPDGWTWSEDVFKSLDPKRCDVCGVRHDRKRLFVLVREADNREVVVGGSCVVKSFPVNLESEIRKAFSFMNEFRGGFDDEDSFDRIFGGGCRSASGFDLANCIAISEVLCDTFGFVSAKAASDGRSTSYWVRRAIDPPDPPKDRYGRPIPDPDADRIKEILTANFERIAKRTNELFETEFAEYVGHFESKIKSRWSEFDQNCLTLLKRPSVGHSKVGLATYIGSVKRRVAEDKIRAASRDAERVTETGFKGPVGKMIDFGTFIVKNVKARDAFDGGIAYGFLCVNAKHEKVWFKVGERSTAWDEWRSVVGDRIPAPGETIEVTLRGKLKECKSDISFASSVKFVAVRIVREEARSAVA